MAAILLVLGATFSYSGYDILRKQLAGRLDEVPLLLFLTAGAVPVFGVWLLVEPVSRVLPTYWWPGFASLALNVLANFGFLRSVKLSGLSVTIPLLSLTPVFTSLAGWMVLGESLSGRAGVGIALTVLGAILLQIPDSERQRGRFLRPEPGALWMVVVALAWSIAMPYDKQAIAAANSPFHGLVLHLGIAIAAALWIRGRRARFDRVSGRDLGRVGLAVLVGSLAMALQFAALSLVWVGFVETLKRGVGSAIALVAGRIFFREEITRIKVSAVAMIALGVAVILW